jgi:hypothetical protein
MFLPLINFRRVAKASTTFAQVTRCAGCALLLIVGALPAFAQDTPSWNKTAPKATAPRPAAKPAAKPARPRPAPPRRAAAPRPAPPRVAAAPLLSIQYRVFKVNPDNSQIEVSPVTVFNPGDRVRFAVKANDEIFLYIVHQQTPDGTGKLLFPDSRFNNGQNLVRKDQEFVIPSVCAAGGQPAACSLQVNANAGKEFYTLIFSRDAALDFYSDTTGANAGITSQTMNRLLGNPTVNSLSSRRGDTVFSLRVSNSDARLNERIVVRYTLNKRGREVASEK